MMSEYENWPKDDWTKILKGYGIALAAVILGVVPWAVGVFTLGRWLFF